MASALAAPSSLNVVDSQATFRVIEAVRSKNQGVFAYGTLLECLARIRRIIDFRDADASFAPIALSLSHEPQNRFVEALRKFGYLIQEVDYKHARITDITSQIENREERHVSSLSPQIAYLIGLLASRAKPEIVLVTGSFDCYYPLLDFVQNRGGKAAICFFRRYLDERWIQVGLTDPESPIAFYDLEPSSEELLGVTLYPNQQIGNRPRSGGLAEI